MVRFARFLILGVALACGATRAPVVAQEQAKPAPKDRMFSGTVTAMSEGSLTVTSTASKDSKTFSITADTRFEGPKPQVRSRVDIRYTATEDGDRALRVIVRGPAKTK